MIFLILIFPLLSFASIDAEVGAYSNFIWRGTTFTENKPAIQGELDGEIWNGFYGNTFFSNAEFSDNGLHRNASVTSEIDATLGKRWNGHKWEIQVYYSRFSFPGAGVFDTDEWNFQAKYHAVSLELSYMDDYFGYQTQYYYARIGYEWVYKDSVDGALFVGYNAFSRAKGNVRERQTFQTLDGAGNSDYVDVFFVNRKTFENQTAAELDFNWTNRYEYTVDSSVVTKERAKDFAVVIAYIIPFTL